MTPHDDTYLGLLDRILTEGEHRTDRTGTGTLSVFGDQRTYDLSQCFPLLTLRKLSWKAIVAETLWFVRGLTDEASLLELGCKWWGPWVKDDGTFGPIYGKQWRDFGGVDQLLEVIEGIKTNPTGRRHIVSAWNPPELPDMALPPCHTLYQFYVRGGRYLDLQLYQRSADAFLGVPHNIASYALLLSLVASEVDLMPGRFIHSLGDAHIYLNHTRQVRELQSRQGQKWDGRHDIGPFLETTLVPIVDIEPDDIIIENYDPDPAITGAPVAV